MAGTQGSGRHRLLDRARRGAARARTLLSRFLRTRRSAASKGTLEVFQRTVEALETHVAAHDLPVDLAHLRGRLEALLSVLLHVADDALAAEAAGPLETYLAVQLPRLERLLLRPGDFYAELRPDHPGVAAACAAAQKNDHEAARRHLHQHLRQRPLAASVASWFAPADGVTGDEAALASRGFFRATDSAFAFVDWPVRWDLVPARAHRHDELPVLVGTKLAVPYLLGWMAAVPPPGGHEVAAWAPAAVSARLRNWVRAYAALHESRAFTPEVARLWAWLLHESAEHLATCLARVDDADRADAAAGLAAACLFDEFAAAPRWREAAERSFAAAARAALPDGGDASGALQRHERDTAAFVTGALCLPGEDSVRTPAAKMLAFEAGLLLPDGRLPGEPQAARRDGAARRARVALAGQLLGVPAADAAEFHAFVDSGYYVMRTSSEYLMLRGVGARDIVAAGAAGDALRLVGRGAADAAAPPPPEGPRSVVIRAGPPSDYVRTVTGLARGGSTHRREVLFVDRRYFVDCDRFRSESEEEWTLEADVEGAVAPSADGRRVLSAGWLMVLAGPTDCAFRIVDRSAPPAPPRARLRAATRAADARFLVLLYPLRADAPDDVTVEPLARGNTAIALLLRRPGSEDLVGFAHGAQDGLGGLPSCSEAAALSRPAGVPAAPWRRLFELYGEAP